jgi:hypothetical protein
MSDWESEEMRRSARPFVTVGVAGGRPLLLLQLWRATRAVVIGGWKTGVVPGCILSLRAHAGIMWKNRSCGSHVADHRQRFIRSTRASLKSNQSLTTLIGVRCRLSLPSAGVAHDQSRVKSMTASTGSIVYTSQVTEITGVLEAGKSEGGGGGE